MIVSSSGGLVGEMVLGKDEWGGMGDLGLFLDSIKLGMTEAKFE